MGGGVVATTKVEALLKTGATVTVISPQVTAVIEKRSAANQVQLLGRPYGTGDLRGFYLAYAATGVATIDEQMAQDAESKHVLLNVAE